MQKEIMMQIWKLLWFGFIFLQTLYALDIDAQITQIKNAPPQERVKLMNAFKVQLSKMNETQREKAISTLRATISTRHAENTKHTNIYEHTVSQHIQQQNLHQEQFHQHQALDQAFHSQELESITNSMPPNQEIHTPQRH